MLVFFGDIAFILELALVSFGLITLHYADKEVSKRLKYAGYIMIIGGTLTMLCTGYYAFQFWVDGSYSLAMPMILEGK